jgi:hypothetical protein|tara:strand:- start:23 stop:469 length:447 start_codon:yes stop_codon:yes gene_type:complete
MTTLGLQQRERSAYKDNLGVARELAPKSWTNRGGSEPEYYIYKALQKRGLIEGTDFVYQSPQAGGRMQLGGAVVDFLLVFPPIGINVQSLYYHATKAAQRNHDIAVRSTLEGKGIQVVYIDEDEAINDPDGAVADAISGRGSNDPIGL